MTNSCLEMMKTMRIIGEANENSVDGASTGDDLEGTSTPFLNTRDTLLASTELRTELGQISRSG